MKSNRELRPCRDAARVVKLLREYYSFDVLSFGFVCFTKSVVAKPMKLIAFILVAYFDNNSGGHHLKPLTDAIDCRHLISKLFLWTAFEILHFLRSTVIN